MDKASIRLVFLCGLVTFLCLRGAVRAWITAVHTKAMGFDWDLSHVGQNSKMQVEGAELGQARRLLFSMEEERVSALGGKFVGVEGERPVHNGIEDRNVGVVSELAAAKRRLLRAVSPFDVNEEGFHTPNLLTASA